LEFMTRPVLLPLLTAALVGASACGGTTTPMLERAVADGLAQRADRLSAALASGDGCAGIDAAGELRRDTTRSARAGDIPPEVRDEVIAVTDEITADLSCEPAPEEPPPPPRPAEGDDDDDDDDDEREKKPKGKKPRGKKDDRKGDEPKKGRR
jgi:hypothetical protein